MIASDVRAAVGALDGVDDVEVRFVAEPAWTPERITADGAGVDGVVLRRRRRLARAAGDVPPLRCRGARRAVGVRAGALPVDPALPVVR